MITKNTKYSKKLYNSNKEADQLVSCISNKQFLDSVYNQYLNAGGKGADAKGNESLIYTTAVGTCLLMAMHKDKNVVFNGPIYSICCQFIKQKNKMNKDNGSGSTSSDATNKDENKITEVSDQEI